MKALKFTLFTEDGIGFRANVKTLVRKYFDGATLTPGEGIWRGSEEASLKIEILVMTEDVHLRALARGNIRLLADEIKKMNLQAAVLVSEEELEAEMI